MATGIQISSPSENFANADLTFTGNREHDTAGNTLQITTDGGGFGESFIYMSPTLNEIGTAGAYTDYTTRIDHLVSPTGTIQRIAPSGVSIGFGSIDAQARLDVKAQGALSTDIALRVRNSADTRDLFYVTGVGGVFSHGQSNVTSNIIIGSNTALQYASAYGVAAANNICIGNGLSFHTTGARNVSIGNGNVLSGNGDDCVAVGHATGSGGANQSTLIGSGGSGNFIRSTKVGFNAALYCAATDSVFLGNSAGANFGSSGGFNTANTQSVLIGVNSKTLANSDVNEIVIGFNATGSGSNTATIGNTSIVKTILRGTINAANLPTSSAGLVAGDIWNNGGVLNIV